MAKGEVSKEFIIETSVPIFNTKGYTGTSLQDVMRETGFTKGGIYRHFSSKEELATAAFSSAYGQMKAAYVSSFEPDDPAHRKLLKFLTAMKTFLLQPPVKGGCPILNSATEVDDTNEPLRRRVKAAAKDWEALLTAVFEDGKRKGDFRKTVDAEKEARLFIASVEGCIMLCRLHRDVTYGISTIDALMERINGLRA